MPSRPEKITLIDNEFTVLWYHPAEKIIHHKFKKYTFGEPFREMLNRGTAAMDSYKACKWLSDDRGNGAITKEDGEWAQTIWFPHTLAVGWKFWAVVMPAMKLGEMNMRRWIKTFGDLGITAHPFSDDGEAFQWLSAQK